MTSVTLRREKGAIPLPVPFAGLRAGPSGIVDGCKSQPSTAKPRDIALVPEPRQPENRLPVTAQPAGSLPGPDLAAVRGQQPGHEQDPFPGDVEHDTIGDHAEPLPVYGDLQRDLFYRGSASIAGISGYVRVSAQMPLTSRMTDSTLLRKPH